MIVHGCVNDVKEQWLIVEREIRKHSGECLMSHSTIFKLVSYR